MFSIGESLSPSYEIFIEYVVVLFKHPEFWGWLQGVALGPVRI